MNKAEATAAAGASLDHLHMMVRGFDGTILYWSRALQDLFGWSAEEAQGQVFHRFLSTELPRLLQDIEAELLHEGSVDIELTHRRKDGERVPLAARWVLHRHADGKPATVVESAVDIGRIKAAAERLRQREELLRLCIDGAPAGIAMYDRHMHYIAASRTHLDDLGLDEGAPVIGRSVYEVIPAMPERWRAVHQRCLAGAHESCEADPFRRRDGSEDWYRWKMRPWRAIDGTPAGVVLLSEKITERVRAEEARRESERRAHRSAELLDKIVASMADAVLVVDEAGRTILANPACGSLLGRDPQIGAPAWQPGERLRPDGTTPYPPAETPLARAARGENFDNVEILWRRVGEADGVHVVASGRSIRDESGRHEGAVIVYRDVTALVETQRQLRQAHKMEAIGQLTGGIAHDFNNLLTVIMGTIEILGQGLGDRPKLAAIATMIEQAATRGADLTQRLLAFGRRQPLLPRPTDLNALVTESAGLLQQTLGEHVDIVCALQADAGHAMVDASQLSTAILNLAVNARDAMPEGGTLTLKTASAALDQAYAAGHAEAIPGRYLMLEVSDTGTGIPAAIRDRVIEPFFTTKEVGKGTGMGLSMVYGFVKQSGGHLEIASEEGRGTAIRLYLPYSGDDGVAALAGAGFTAAAAGGNETILVVEDDPLVRRSVLAQLEKLGYRTLAAGSGAEALALVDSGARFDLLLTDVMMPGGMNGRQLAEALGRRNPDVKVLYTSGYAEDVLVHSGRLGQDFVLLKKPYQIGDLARAVREVLAGGRPAAAPS